MNAQHKNNLERALILLESFLDGHDYFVGNYVTIADFAFCSSIATLIAIGFDIKGYGKISTWFERMRSLKGFEQLEEGSQQQGKFVTSILKNSFADF